MDDVYKDIYTLSLEEQWQVVSKCVIKLANYGDGNNKDTYSTSHAGFFFIIYTPRTI